MSGDHYQVAGPCSEVRVAPSFTKRAGSTLLTGNRLWRPDHITGEKRWRDEGTLGSRAGGWGRLALTLPGGLRPLGLARRKCRGQTPPPGSETGARGGRGGEEGRGEGAWPARRRRALGGGAAAPRSRLWGLGFAALRALGREQERGKELRSQSSHRDERRSPRLGFSLRPAALASRPDRWEGAAGTGTASPGTACAPRGLEHSRVCQKRWLPPPGGCCALASGKIRGGPGTLLPSAMLTCARSPPLPLGVGALSCGSFGNLGGEGA